MKNFETVSTILNEMNIPFDDFDHSSEYRAHHVWKIPSDRAFDKRETKSFSIALINGMIEVWKWCDEEPISYGSDFIGAIAYVRSIWKKECIASFAYGSEEYRKLETVAELLNMGSPNGYHYHVEKIFFDYGQNWKWTTILCEGNGSEWQALCPREQEDIIFADTIKDLARVARKILNDSELDKKGA